MNADLLAMLGGAGAVGGGAANANAGRRSDGKVVLNFKAGKMEHVLQPNGKYLVSPTQHRGEINLLWQVQSAGGAATTAATTNNAANNSGVLKFEWRDRRTKTTDYEATIFPEDRCTYTKVPTNRNPNNNDRVYLLQYGNNSDRRHFFWMQDKDDLDDEGNCTKMSGFLKNPATAANVDADGNAIVPPPGGGAGAQQLDLSGIVANQGGSGGSGTGAAAATPAAGGGTSASALDNAALVQIMQGIGAGSGGSAAAAAGTSTSGGSASSSSGGAGQVDALSNILQNMGMPPPADGSTSSSSAAGATATPAASSASRSGGTLTLADLQGAMAGLATSSPPPPTAGQQQPPGPPLNEVATASAIESSGILSSESTRQRLMELLPENQRTEEMLLENIRSPQVQQSLKSLSSALVGDNFNEIIANFQMNPSDGADALAGGNPIQAFLDCLLASVKKEKEEAGESGEKKEEEEEGKKGDDAMEE